MYHSRHGYQEHAPGIQHTLRCRIALLLLAMASVLCACTRRDQGTLAFASDRDGDWDIYTLREDGSRLTRITDSPGNDENPDWSPDGQRIAFQSDRNGNSDIYLFDLRGRRLTQITDHDAEDVAPAWSPDGASVAFMSDRSGNWDIYVADLISDTVTQVTRNPAWDAVPTWSRDGTARITFASSRHNPELLAFRLYTTDREGSLVSAVFPDSDVYLSDPAWYPGDRLLLAATYTTPMPQVAVIDLQKDDLLARPAVVVDGPAWLPAWSPDGRYLAYVAPTQEGRQIFVVEVDDLLAAKSCCRMIADQVTIEGNSDSPAWRP
jgi:TolB protein